MEFLIRPATKHEIPEIESEGVAAYTQYRDEVPAAIFDAYVEDLRHLAEHWDEAAVLVAEVDGRIAGNVLFYANASTEGLGLPEGWAKFRKLAVRPEMRGRLLGR
jgi:predicted N-acetyltransferase YhbS